VRPLSKLKPCLKTIYGKAFLFADGGMNALGCLWIISGIECECIEVKWAKEFHPILSSHFAIGVFFPSGIEKKLLNNSMYLSFA
jgi:hypothetical protein